MKNWMLFVGRVEILSLLSPTFLKKMAKLRLPWRA